MLLDTSKIVETDLVPDGVAGHRTDRFAPTYVPIASHKDGTFLFVDLGSGPDHGCVREWADTDGDLPPRWATLAALIGDSATLAARAAACSVIDGELIWTW